MRPSPHDEFAMNGVPNAPLVKWEQTRMRQKHRTRIVLARQCLPKCHCHMIAPMPAAGFATPFAYDALGRQVASTDPLANTVHTAYDPEGRVLARWGATYPVLYAYDARGNLVSATVDGVSTNLYAYDVFGNITNEVQNGTVIARDYDVFGRPTGYALGGFAPSREVHYAYDALGRFASVTAGGSGDVPRPLPTFTYTYLPGTDLGEWCLSPFLHVGRT